MTWRSGWCGAGNHDYCAGSTDANPAREVIACDCRCHHQREDTGMTLRIYDVEQRSPEWYDARCGIVTASVVGKLLTDTLRVAGNETSRGLLTHLAAERVASHVEDTYQSADMFRGVLAEPFARDLYAKHAGAVVESCGFMVRDIGGGVRLGYSPDGLVGDDGLIEIKAPRQKGHLSTVVGAVVPGVHMAQIQAGLLVSGRAWCDFISYCGGMALWPVRVEPDPEWQAAIVAAVTAAEQAIAETVATYEQAVTGLPVAERIDFETPRLEF